MTEPNPEFLVGVLAHKPAPDDRLVTMVALSFGRYRINRGSGDGAFYDDGW